MASATAGPRATGGDLGRRIRDRRTQLGLTREELAAHARMDPGYLQYVEERPAALSTSAATRLAGALDITLDELLGGARPASQPAPSGVMEVLDRDECLRLLRRNKLGRVAFSAKALLVVLPVNYAVVRDGVIIRTGETTQLATTAPDTVAFETDEIAQTGPSHSAWSVVVQGSLTQVTDTDLDRLRRLPLLDPWAPGSHPVYLRIETEHISGRRFVID